MKALLYSRIEALLTPVLRPFVQWPAPARRDEDDPLLPFGGVWR